MTISDDIKSEYLEGSHPKILTIYFPDLDYTVPTNEVYYESMSLTESIFDGDSFEAIGCIASEFEISIRDFGEDIKGKIIHASMELGDLEDSSIDLFHGIVDSVALESDKRIKKITAYDELYSKGNTDVASWYNSFSFPCTLKQFRDGLFQYIEIEQEDTTLPNDDITIIKQYSPKTANALDFIKSLCQINGVFGMMSRQGVFEYRTLSNTSVQDIPHTRNIEYQEYTVSPVDKLTIRQTEDELGISYGSGDNNYIIQGNMFTYGLGAETIYGMARSLYPNVSNISYIPFESESNGLPWVECGEFDRVKYSVYDFDNSGSGVDVYKDITFIVFTRHMKGIQSLVDEYSAKGDEYQRVFITDLSSQLEVLKQTVENLEKGTSTEVAVYRNANQIVIADGQQATVADIAYSANEGNTVVFHEELSLLAESTETVTEAEYTENDPTISVDYYVNGKKLANHVSTGTLIDGTNIVALMQFWRSGVQNSYRLQAIMKAAGGKITVPKLQANAYITVRTSEYDEFTIEVTKEPNKTEYLVGEALDYTGVIITKVYYDDSTPSEDITDKCTFSPANGTVISSPQFIEVNVNYQEVNEVGEVKSYDTLFYCNVEYEQFTLEVTKTPNKTAYSPGNKLDYTGLVISKVYYDESIPSVDVTALCTFEPAEGESVSEEGAVTVKVSYAQQSPSEEPAGQNTFFILTVLDPWDSKLYIDNWDATIDIVDPDTGEIITPAEDPIINIPYVIYSVNKTNRKINMTALDVAAIVRDNPADVYIPATVTTKSGTVWQSVIVGSV